MNLRAYARQLQLHSAELRARSRVLRAEIARQKEIVHERRTEPPAERKPAQ